tara:strand:- start:57 stop:1040 length:984 start_codon:yes stop_codon:yes gene_type:complete
MTVLVTGATGFVGSAVTRLLLNQGATVVVLSRRDSDRTNVADLNVEVREGDLRDQRSLERACAHCDTLFHVAADYRLWTKNSDDLYASNVDGTRNIMRAALECGIDKIVYTSSVATLGTNTDDSSGDENTPVKIDDMIGDYKRSKFLAERVVDELVERDNLPAVIVNPSTPVGPHDIKPTPTGRVIRDAQAGRIPGYVDTGLNIAHVDDVAAGHLLALEHGQVGRRYILGGENLSLHEILRIIAEICGRSPPTLKLPRRLLFPIAYASEAWAWITDGNEPQVTVDGLRMARKKMFFSSARAIKELHYVARPAREALEDAVSWFKDRL